MDRQVRVLSLIIGLLVLSFAADTVRGAEAPRISPAPSRQAVFLTPAESGRGFSAEQTEALDAVSEPLRALRAQQLEGDNAVQQLKSHLPGGTPLKALWSLRGLVADLTATQLEAFQAPDSPVKAQLLPDVHLMSHDTPLEISKDSKTATNENTPWNLVISGAYALSTSRQVSGKGVLISVLAPDVSHSHVSLLGRVKHFRRFGPTAGKDRAQEDLMLIHPLGIMAGTHPNQLMGIAPDVSIALATLPRGKVSLNDYLDAVQWLMEPSPDQKPAVLFLALDFSSPAHRLVREMMRSCRMAGILPVAPAGNVPDRITGAAGLPEVITVAALDQWKKRALFSGQGPAVMEGVPVMKPDLAEPGVSIFGPSYDVVPFRFGSGTLQAAAHFVGVYALLKEARPKESADGFMAALATSSLDLGTIGVDEQTGMGLPDPNAALYHLENPPASDTYPTFYIPKP